MTTKTISWIGLGHMGIPMAHNLLKAGYSISVYNRDISKCVSLVESGANICSSIADAAKFDIIFLMLSDDAAVGAVVDQLLEAGVRGKFIINMSTISVDKTTEIASEIREQGGRYLEGPVSGSVKPATDGTLIVLAGGSPEDFDEARPFFDKLGKLSLLLGEVGQGAKAKLAINYYMSVIIDGLAETVLFAEKNGIERDTMMQIVNASACGSPMSNMKTASILNEDYPAAFPLRHMDKDINLALKQGLATPTAKNIAEAYTLAMNEGLADEDLMAVIKTIKKAYFD